MSFACSASMPTAGLSQQPQQQSPLPSLLSDFSLVTDNVPLINEEQEMGLDQTELTYHSRQPSPFPNHPNKDDDAEDPEGLDLAEPNLARSLELLANKISSLSAPRKSSKTVKPCSPDTFQA